MNDKKYDMTIAFGILLVVALFFYMWILAGR